MSKFDECIARYQKEFTKIGVKKIDEELLRKVAKGCGPSIYNADACKVATSDEKEMARVKKSFLIKRMDQKDTPKLDKAIAKVADKFGSKNRNKFRAMFYYMLTKELKLEKNYK